MRRNGLQDFLKRVHKTESCWIWIGRKNHKGYGYFDFLSQSWLAHRWAKRYLGNEQLNEKHVCHSCDNPSCVNPSHLWLGTNADNMRDCQNKGRRKKASHCKRGHQLEGENIRWNGTHRNCKKCDRIRNSK